MRTALVILASLVTIGSAVAETPARPSPERSVPTDKVLPLKGAGGANPCAAYGAGFVRVEGSGTCVKVGGAMDVGVATSSRR
jgi:hypothetical protein